MDIWHVLTIITMMVVYLCFAGLWGSLLRDVHERGKWIRAFVFGLCVVLPISLSLPVDLPMNLVVWIIALAVIWLYLQRPGLFSDTQWIRRFSLTYIILMMLLIMVWSILADHPMILIWLGIPASYAAFLGIRKALQGG